MTSEHLWWAAAGWMNWKRNHSGAGFEQQQGLEQIKQEIARAVALEPVQTGCTKYTLHCSWGAGPHL